MQKVKVSKKIDFMLIDFKLIAMVSAWTYYGI
jgi:hypothetical protein